VDLVAEPPAKVFVTPALPGDVLDRLSAAVTVDVWDGERPPKPEQLAERCS
jgi:hypothetical protein